MVSSNIMASRLKLTGIIFLFFVFSCTNREAINDTNIPSIQLDMPPKQEIPVLQVISHKNLQEGRALPLWLSSFLEHGITEAESLAAYQGSYLFVSYIHSAKLQVIYQWLENYRPEKDFTRLAAERIKERLELGLTEKPPDKVYGPNYEKAIKAAYSYSFWGATRLDDGWVLALPAVQDQDARPEEPQYWGFILVSTPRETLEIQVIELLSRISNSKTRGGRAATKEQNAAFENVKEHFLEKF